MEWQAGTAEMVSVEIFGMRVQKRGQVRSAGRKSSYPTQLVRCRGRNLLSEASIPPSHAANSFAVARVSECKEAALTAGHSASFPVFVDRVTETPAGWQELAFPTISLTACENRPWEQ